MHQQLQTLIDVRVGTRLRVYLMTTTALSISAAAVAVGLTFFHQEIKNNALANQYNVTITDGVYSANDEDVPFRMCTSESLRGNMMYPVVLLAPGQTVQLDYWTPHCVRLASKGYVVFMKDRVGENYPEWQEEVDAAVEYLSSMKFVDENRIAAMANSFGAQEIQSSGLANPSQFKAFIDDSGFNNPHVMLGSVAEFDIPTLTLSGGGEQPGGGRDCDYDGFTWTTAFAEKMRADNPEYFEDQIVFTMEEYGCVHHGYLWDTSSKAAKDAMRIILAFLDEKLGRDPVPKE